MNTPFKKRMQKVCLWLSLPFVVPASVRAKSSRFEKDIAAVNATTRRFGAVVQYEQKPGNPGNRE